MSIKNEVDKICGYDTEMDNEIVYTATAVDEGVVQVDLHCKFYDSDSWEETSRSIADAIKQLTEGPA
jgi:hypothetical protein